MSTTRGAAVAEWWPWLVLPAFATGLVSAGLALGLTDPDGTWIKGEAWVNIPLAIGFSTVAAGIWSTRPHTVGVRRLGALYTVTGLAAACALPSFGIARTDTSGAAAAAWVSNWVWALGAAPLLGIGMILYPEGHLPGRRWWPALVLGMGGPLMLALSQALTPGPLENHPRIENPLGMGDRADWMAVGFAGFVALMVAGVLGLAALVVKFKEAPTGGDARGQIRAFVIAAGLLVLVASLPSHDDLAGTLLGIAVATALPVTVGVAVLRHRLLDQGADVEALNRRVKALSASRQHIVNERELERVRLRRELHDELGPSLAAIGLGLRALDQRTGGGEGGVVRELADEVQRAVSEVRRICDGLRPAALNELGLAGALAEGIELLQHFGPRITLTVADLPPLSPAVEVAAFRITMEAVTNAVKHAQAQHVQVHVAPDDGVVVVHVVDDGRGLAEDRVLGVGLLGMSDRADEVGGRLTIRPGTPAGTAVQAWLPAAEHG